uniref:Protein kinase domain-containing protein n=1 Tax=Panagrolaimus sp. PS1159 TaxID=55785 RepID=A0AC35FQ63_9BILA
MGNMADQLVQLDQGKKVKRWTIEKKLGEGAFGAVYKVSDKTGTYTLKVEGVNEPIQLLKMEVLVLNELSKAGGRHFCKIE